MLPWETVLRVWDVFLFDGNRVMLFRTALALMELYACMGYQAVNGTRLLDLRKKHRPIVLAAMEERSKGLRAWRDSQGLASKLYSFKHDPESLFSEANPREGLGGCHTNGELQRSESDSTNVEGFLRNLEIDMESESEPDLKEQVIWLKVLLCRLLEEKRSAVLRHNPFLVYLPELFVQPRTKEQTKPKMVHALEIGHRHKDGNWSSSIAENLHESSLSYMYNSCSI